MEELSNQLIKQIKRYKIKKYRQQEAIFLVEGYKAIEELLSTSIKIKSIIISKHWEAKRLDFPSSLTVYQTSIDKFRQFSSQKNPEGILALCEQPEHELLIDDEEWVIALDKIQDPGNLGTIIRIADWFGIQTILCSVDTVDCYNAKVIQSTMGSIGRVKVIYTHLSEYLKTIHKPLYLATLSGTSYRNIKASNGILVIGNESHGISKEILSLQSEQITILKKGQAESLNAAVATGILVSHLCA